MTALQWLSVIFTVDNILTAILFVFFAWGVYTIYRLHTLPKWKHFDCVDAITTRDGRLDRPAFMEFVVFVLICWGFVVMVLRNNIQEWYVGIMVGSFVFRAAHAGFLRSKYGFTPQADKTNKEQEDGNTGKETSHK